LLKLETTEVPAELAAYYEPIEGGKFRLKVEGAVSQSALEESKSKVTEFRNSNIELKKKVDQLAQFETMFQSGDFSADKINSKVEQLALERAATMKQTFEQQIAELTDGLTKERNNLSNRVLSDEVKGAALKNGVSDTALEDVLSRARGAFKVEDGKLVAVDSNLDAKGNKPTLDSWMATLATAAPHLFQASQGTSAKKPGKPVISLSTDEKLRRGVSKHFSL
jgi:hypothetical protein